MKILRSRSGRTESARPGALLRQHLVDAHLRDRLGKLVLVETIDDVIATRFFSPTSVWQNKWSSRAAQARTVGSIAVCPFPGVSG